MLSVATWPSLIRLKPALGCRPDRAIGSGKYAHNHARSQSLGTCVRFPDLSVFEKQNAALTKPEPDTAPLRIARQKTGIIAVPQRRPGDSFHYFVAEHMNQTFLHIKDPETSGGRFGDLLGSRARDGANRNEPAALQRARPRPVDAQILPRLSSNKPAVTSSGKPSRLR